MDIKFWNQPKDLSLEKVLTEKLNKGFKNAWIIAGVAKDEGIDILLESIKKARELGTDISVYVGIDRKNISKDMLLKLLNLGCHLFLHINREESKVETRVYLFESENNDSYIYQSSGKLSEGGLTSSNCLIQEVIYSQADKKLFDNAKMIIMQGCEVFKQTDEEELKLLAEKGEVVARITERKIPSISEMYGGTSLEDIGNDIYDESTSKPMFDIPDNFDIDIDIDIATEGETKKVELSAESEAKKEKLEKESIEKIAQEKLAKFYELAKEEETDKKVSIIKDISSIDFANTTIFVFEINKIIEKGLGEGEIKIPLYIFEEMKDFFDAENYKTFTDEKGKPRFGKTISLEIIDTNNNEKREDDNALIYAEEKYLALKSNEVKSLRPEENDIVRLIKNGEGYDLELIRKDSKEFSIWENCCKYTMKNSKRKFGIM